MYLIESSTYHLAQLSYMFGATVHPQRVCKHFQSVHRCDKAIIYTYILIITQTACKQISTVTYYLVIIGIGRVPINYVTSFFHRYPVLNTTTTNDDLIGLRFTCSAYSRGSFETIPMGDLKFFGRWSKNRSNTTKMCSKNYIFVNILFTKSI